MPVELSLCPQAYRDLNRPWPTSRIAGRQVNSTVRRSVADTGAQVNIVDAETVRAMGLDTDSLIPSSAVIKGATAGSRMDILGIVFLNVAAPGPPQVRARADVKIPSYCPTVGSGQLSWQWTAVMAAVILWGKNADMQVVSQLLDVS